MGKQKGFSLIELLIVVAIILIIAAIAIPNLMRSRIAANDAAAASTIRTLNTTEITYSTTYPTSGYAQDLATLGPGALACPGTGPTNVNACLLDFTLGCAAMPCVKDAFQYTVTGIGAAAPFTDYVAGGVPVGANAGDKDFCSSSDAVVRYQGDAAANQKAPVTVATCAGGNYLPL